MLVPVPVPDINIFAFCVDPFADDNEGGGSSEGHIHIRIQQRNGRKTLTTVQGIRPDYDLKKIVKACKKVCIFSQKNQYGLRSVINLF